MVGWFPSWTSRKLTRHIYLINDVLVWSKPRWTNHGQFWHPLQSLHTVRIPIGKRLPQQAWKCLQLSVSNLYEHPGHICKRTGVEVYCLVKCHRIHHHYCVCVAIALCSDNNSDTKLNFRLLYHQMYLILKCVRNDTVRCKRFASIGRHEKMIFFTVKDLLTFIIKVDIEFIFWDDFFVNSFIIC